MSYKELMSLYSFICSRKRIGVTVKELMEYCSLKKKDIIKFLSILQEYNENIIFYYYSPKEDEFIEELDKINEESIIEVEDDFKNVSLKLNFEESVKLYNIMEESFKNTEMKDRVVNSLGKIDTNRYTYITKGISKDEINSSSKKLKNKIIECILNNMIIDICFKEAIHRVAPLGIYYNSIKKNYYLVADFCNELCEYPIEKISRVKYTGLNHQIEFNISKYRLSKRNITLKLKVYKEANVLEKLKGILAGYKLRIETQGEYSILETKVEAAEDFFKIINSFGRSVIVIEPIGLRNAIMEDTIRLVEAYSKIGKKLN